MYENRACEGTMMFPQKFPKWTSRIVVRPYFDLLTSQQALSFCIFSSMAIAVWTFCISLFELHLYAMVKHDVTYYGTWGMSYEFVYSGTDAVRSALIFFCVLSVTVSVGLLVTSALLLGSTMHETNLRQEMFLIAAVCFLVFRTVSYIFSSFVNDSMYNYWVVMGLVNTLLMTLQAENWLVFWTLYLNARSNHLDKWGTARQNGRSQQTVIDRTTSQSATHVIPPQAEVVSVQELLVFDQDINQPGGVASPLLPQPASKLLSFYIHAV